MCELTVNSNRERTMYYRAFRCHNPFPITTSYSLLINLNIRILKVRFKTGVANVCYLLCPAALREYKHIGYTGLIPKNSLTYQRFYVSNAASTKLCPLQNNALICSHLLMMMTILNNCTRQHMSRPVSHPAPDNAPFTFILFIPFSPGFHSHCWI